MEKWKLVNGFKYEYFISNKGIIKNNKDIILKPIIDKDGYLRIRLVDNQGKRRWNFIHRFVCIYFNKGDNSLTVNHIDGNKKNNINSNLEWLSQTDNNKHAYSIGLKNHKGENHPRSKLTLKEVTEIRNFYNTTNINQSEIAIMYNTKQARISEIIKFKTWR